MAKLIALLQLLLVIIPMLQQIIDALKDPEERAIAEKEVEKMVAKVINDTLKAVA